MFTVIRFCQLFQQASTVSSSSRADTALNHKSGIRRHSAWTSWPNLLCKWAILGKCRPVHFLIQKWWLHSQQKTFFYRNYYFDHSKSLEKKAIFTVWSSSIGIGYLVKCLTIRSSSASDLQIKDFRTKIPSDTFLSWLIIKCFKK